LTQNWWLDKKHRAEELRQVKQKATMQWLVEGEAFSKGRDFISLNPLQVAGNILLLAGDIVPLLQIDRRRDFFDLMRYILQNSIIA
jgi:hypothetical protein